MQTEDGRQKIVVKVSGDLRELVETLDFIKAKTKEGLVFVLIGGGSDITAEIAGEDSGYNPIFTPLGRVLPPELEPQRLKVLLSNQRRLIANLNRLGISAGARLRSGVEVVVDIPYGKIGGVSYPQNADRKAIDALLGFDEVYILTLSHRVKKKRRELKPIIDAFPNLHIIPINEKTTTPTTVTT